ncbi:VOC family protein [Halomarina oriensis]|uniref:VOC family protein n=1 Tax=Halomarina oriensis TaxID=671145 RepID=A0A6B0GHA2_9EURY|nr:VOC family protein [Halomarina oriensis]MWG33970.1 VOC family protein [Halomarina oriensis]
MGLVFFRTTALADLVAFYTDVVGARVWHEQPACTILEHGAFRVGFCDGDETETDGVLTFVYPNRAGVDAAHERLHDHGVDTDGDPRFNERYDIYQFFAEDPDGRTVEFQTFEH